MIRMQGASELIHTLMQSRQTILPKRLNAPGADALHLQQILAAALLERDAAALPAQLQQAREKSHFLRTLFALNADEHALCFASIGTAGRGKPASIRPAPEQYLSTLRLDTP